MAEVVKLVPGRDKQTWLRVCLGEENVGEKVPLHFGFLLTEGNGRPLAQEH